MTSLAWRRGHRSLSHAASVPALLAIAVFVLPAAGGFTEAEFKCEEAASTLEECCPELAVKALSCARETGCAGETLRPAALQIAESECIIERSCHEIVEAGICQRVEVRQLEVEADEPAPWEETPVCP